MNQDEGHLGGYIRSRHSATPTTHRLEHGDPATFTPALWEWCVETLGVRSVLDVGCGEGHAARHFADLGCRVLAVDGSREARRDSRVPDRHVLHDYAQGAFFPGEDFDLVWSCEFVEHVEERYREHFLATFEAGHRYLLMTHAPPGQRGHHHVNCQPREYWIEAVEGIGYRFDEALTREARERAERGHFRRHGLAFAR